MQLSIRVFAIPFILAACLLCVSHTTAQQEDTEEFELHESVINDATGEPVTGALVQLLRNAQFSATNGTFVFTNLPRGRYSLWARKPGFFTEQDLGRSSAWSNSWHDVPSNVEMVLKLVPESIIYGEVKEREWRASRGGHRARAALADGGWPQKPSEYG